MGFLENLQDIGFGNRGPYGRMMSGATNYANYAQQRTGVEAERGVSQALALAAKEGKPISFQQMSEIAEKWGPWGVDINGVMQRAKVLNEGIEAEGSKTRIHKLMGMWTKLSDDDKTDKKLMEYGQQLGMTQKDLIIFAEGLKKLQPQSKTVVTGPGETITETKKSLSGKTTTETLYKHPAKKEMSKTQKPITVKPGESVIDQNGKVIFSLPKTADIKKSAPRVLRPGDILVDETGKVVARHPDDMAKKQKVGTNWVLPNLDIVTSFDGGRTYTKEGKQAPMPSGAWKSSAQLSGTDMLTLTSKQGVVAEAPAQQADTGMTATEAAREGTGPYATIGAAIDAVAGGFGLDALIGKDGFFKDTQDARQQLRTIKQLGKQALMNSSRGAIWEQKRIDRLFPDPDKFLRNPSTEARKFKSLRKELLIEKDFNNKAIALSNNPKEINKLRGSNLGIDRLLSHIGTGEKNLTDDELMKMYQQE